MDKFRMRLQLGALVAVAAVGGALLGGAISAGPAQSQSTADARVQRLEDLQAIEQLMVGDYPQALDGRNWKAYGALFTADGELVQGTNVIKGPAAIEENFSRPRTPRPAAPAAAPAPGAAPGAAAAPSGPPISKHVVTNLLIKLNGDRATATGYWQTISTRGRTTTVAGAGHYVDSLRKVNGQWKFQRREIVNPLRDAAATAPTAPTS